jgi:hypothetical protein
VTPIREEVLVGYVDHIFLTDGLLGAGHSAEA